MTDPIPVPDQAVTAAAEAMGRSWTTGGQAALSRARRDGLARAALEGAAPAIREAERQRIRQLAVAAEAVYCEACRLGRCEASQPAGSGEHLGTPFADLIGRDHD